MITIKTFESFSELDIIPKSKKIFSQAEMAKSGGMYNLQHGILAMIPISKVDGLDPAPGSWTDDEGNTHDFTKGTKVDKPIEVIYDEDSDLYMLQNGNHRMQQALLNGDDYIIAFVQASSRKIYNKLLENKHSHQ